MEADFFNLFSTPVQKVQTIQNIKESHKLKPKSKELYIKYTKYPSQIYAKQRFIVELEAKILTPYTNFDFISTTYSNNYNVEIISGRISWEKTDNNRYITQITYKAKDKNFILPTIRLALELGDEEISSIEIKAPKINYTKIAINQTNFSNIIATDLKIKSIQTKQYNNKMLMIVCNIETQNGNLEEFHLNQFQEQGIKNFQEKYPMQSMFYYIIIPSHMGSVKFTYYNPKSLKFITVELPIILEENLVSTQTDLNPNNGNLLLYKQITSLILLMLSIIFYIITKNRFSIMFIIIFTFISIKLFLPKEKIYLLKNTKVYILPTKLSTIYKIIDSKNKVEILMEKDDFIKVLFKNKSIGWIRKKDVK